jgi:Flp pilus assembly protein TadD
MLRISWLFSLLLAACATGQPRVPRPTPEMARVALDQGSPQIALQLADSVLVREPANRKALLVRADTLTALGQRDQAAAAYQQVLRLDPRAAPAMLGLGRYYLSTDPARAEAEFLTAATEAPHDAVAQNDLGIARDLQGRHDEAQEAYRRALAADPQMEAAQVNLALSLAFGGQARQGAQLLNPIASAPGASQKLRHDLAAVLALAGERDEAAHILSADLSPDEVAEALRAYETAGPAAFVRSETFNSNQGH